MGPAMNGAGADKEGAETDGAEFAELRQLLVGPEIDRIATVEDRLNDHTKRAAESGRVLPDAIRNAKPKPLREALEPVFEKVFESSVRKHPRELADAIFPVIGPAIRKSMAAAIAEFAETLNQIVEKSVSFRAVRWRAEALVTGKPFSEILISRSLLYSVEQVFLIHRKSGILLQHAAAENSVLRDADMISGMLTAIQDFLTDSFAEGGQNLETVDIGRFKLWIQYGSKALVVGAVSGVAPAGLKGIFQNAVEKIHEQFYAELNNFRQNDVSVFEPAQPILRACLLGQSAPGRKPKTWPVWVAISVVVALVSGFVWQRLREQSRWEAYFDSLKHKPGLVIISVEKRGPMWIVAGLKDPLAPAPSHDHVRFQWQPYLSLDTPFANERELQMATEQLSGQLIRFDAASARIPAFEEQRIQEVSATIGKLLRLRPAVRILVTGRADETGSPEMNDKLSAERAKSAIDVLVAQGVAPEHLQAVAVGNTQPLRKGSSAWDMAINRSVSFGILP
jgi:OOP family OmpA-OmpF porin